MSEAIHTMFSDIAPRYDKANSILSLGVHHLWRSITVKESGVKTGGHVLDCATGTGDLALAFKRVVGPTGRVLGTDFNADMLSFAPAKARGKGLDVEFEVADAMKLPYQDATFDVSSISFGIRNVDSPAVALGEMARVVKPGGRVVVLEFGQPKGIMGLTYRWYSKNVIPLIGGMVTGHRKAYEYLPTTAAAFPCREEFLELMRSTGRLVDCRYRELTGGIAFLYIGTVISK
ncbi:MAG: bifunctional demethylmenaquinone methyltransferase/2-methoxy-6-polyprenyl-1,4-benzoquinol methylase UbiE [Candidatus Kapabacteria bacterium]|nr:bifunctional demethylmenaquinone methyltransferase/2-methoxy-6-polyprenyl-1,4-benzoquinol methylase UbiE [Candidatus Kapabacteria bacterium]